MRLAALPLLLVIASPALAADQFDLACKGTRTAQRGGAAEPYSFRVHVDLAAQKWCEEACETVQPMVSVDDDKLVFVDDATLNTRLDLVREVTFDRKTNSFVHHFSQFRPTDAYLSVKAQCTTEASTPFPAGK